MHKLRERMVFMMNELKGALRQKREELIAKYIQDAKANKERSVAGGDEELNLVIKLCASQRINRAKVTATEAVGQ